MKPHKLTMILLTVLSVLPLTVRAQETAVSVPPAEQLARAERLLIGGKYRDALEMFRKLHKTVEKDSALRLQVAWGMAQCLAAQEDWEQAAVILAAAAGPRAEAPAEALWFAAEAYCRAGRHEAGAELYKLAAGRGGPGANPALLHYAICLVRAGKPEQADAALKQYVRRVQEPKEAARGLLQRAVVTYKLGRFAEARKLAAEAAEKGGAEFQPRSAVVIAMAALAEGDSAAAAHALKQVRAAGAAGEIASQLQLLRGLTTVEQGGGEALKDVAARLGELPQFKKGRDRLRLLLYLARLNERAGRLEESLKLLSEARDEAPPDMRPRLDIERGRLLVAMRRIEDAFEAYGRAGDRDRIVSLCKAILASDTKQPGRFVASFRLALIHAAGKEFDRADECLAEGVVGLDAPALLNLAAYARAYFLEQKGQVRGALEGYEKIALECEGDVGRVARSRALLLANGQGWHDRISQFHVKLQQKKPRLEPIELCVIARSYAQSAAEAPEEEAAKLRAFALPLYRQLLKQATASGGEQTHKKECRRLFGPALARFVALAETESDLTFALQRVQDFALQTLKDSVDSGDAGAPLSLLDYLVAGELCRRFGQWTDAVELFGVGLSADPPPLLADLLRLQMADCLTAAGCGARARTLLTAVQQERLRAAARVGMAAALAEEQRYDEALQQIGALLKDADAAQYHTELERLRANVQSAAERDRK